MLKENHVHEAPQMFTPIKVAKDIKNGELGEEMFDDIPEGNTGNTSLNINMTVVTNILHSDALNCDSIEANSQLLHAHKSEHKIWWQHTGIHQVLKNNIRHTSSVCEGQEQVNSSVPEPQVSKPKRGRGRPHKNATKTH